MFTFFIKISRGDKDFYHSAAYDHNPIEVNAENVGYVTTQYLYSKLPINFVSNEDNRIYQKITLGRLLHCNYEFNPKTIEVYSPTERVADYFTDELLQKGNMDMDKYAKIVCDNDVSLYKKLMLGLPITYPEYTYADLLIKSLDMNVDGNMIKKLHKRI